MWPPRLARTAARAPGSTTPITGMSTWDRRSTSACAVAVLQAITIALTSCAFRNPVISRL
jgi:hypothetical protein